MVYKKDGFVSQQKSLSGARQICRIPSIFPDFEMYMDKHMFNVSVLNEYFERLTQELLKLFDQKKSSVECFQGDYVYGGRDWYTGEYWRTSFIKHSLQRNNLS